MKNKEIINCAENLLAMNGSEIPKQKVMVAIQLNKKTKQLSPNEQNNIIDRVWVEINNKIK